MTTKQFRKMKVFALRMTPTAIRGGRWQKELRDHVLEVLSRLDCENFGIHYSTITNWDHHEPIPGDDGTCGFAWSHPRALLCDFMSEYCWDHNLKKEKEDRKGNCEVVDSKMGIALRCCIRAACDVAVAPSAGVLGWTVGDLKKMWKGRKLPKWVTDFWEGDITTAPDEAAIWL